MALNLPDIRFQAFMEGGMDGLFKRVRSIVQFDRERRTTATAAGAAHGSQNALAVFFRDIGVGQQLMDLILKGQMGIGAAGEKPLMGGLISLGKIIRCVRFAHDDVYYWQNTRCQTALSVQGGKKKKCLSKI